MASLERKTRIDTLGAVLLVTIMITLGLNQVAIKVVNEAISPLMQAGLRSLFAIPLMAAYMAIRGKPFDWSWAILVPGIATGICFAVEFALLFSALELTSVGRTTIFFYTMPFWVALGAHFLIPGERMSVVKFAGLVLACAGVAVALYPQGGNPQTSFLGDVMALVGAIFWAAIALIARTTRLSTVTPELQLFYQIVVSAIILVPAAIFIGQGFRDPTLMHWSILALQVVVVVCISFVTWFWILSVYPASDMASFGFLSPLFGVLFGWLFLGETITWTIVAALVLVAVGIVLVNRRPRPHP